PHLGTTTGLFHVPRVPRHRGMARYYEKGGSGRVLGQCHGVAEGSEALECDAAGGGPCATHGAGRNYAATILVTVLVQYAAGAGRSPGGALRRRPERAPMQDAGDTFAPSTPSEADTGVV